jgi:Zn-dependent alcohol dehydrogenase
VYRGLAVGGFAEYALVAEAGAIKIDNDIPLDVACVIGCSVQTGVGAVLNTARVEPGATVLVMGLGGVGISIVQGARIAGASRIIVSDPNDERREAAARFGATDAVDPKSDDLMATVMRVTGVGVDYAFDAVGSSALVEAGMWACRPGGTTVLVGAAPIDQVVHVPATLFMVSERKLIGSLLGGCNGRREVPRLLGLWQAGRLDLEGMITHRRPLAEVNEAFADMQAGRGIRTVLTV